MSGLLPLLTFAENSVDFGRVFEMDQRRAGDSVVEVDNALAATRARVGVGLHFRDPPLAPVA